MRRWIAGALLPLLVAGCAPKMGEDILIEPEGKLYLQNSPEELAWGVLSLLGLPVSGEEIRLGGEVKVTNRWGRDLTLVSLTYTLNDGTGVLARGEANGTHPLTVASGEVKRIPIVLRIDPSSLSASRVAALVEGKKGMTLRGDAVIEVWGIRQHYAFEKDATQLILKALRHQS